ncbi:MAG: helix-hairpin-helix domain-containing protein [Gammaproteobacteria bacterium]
MGPHHHGLYQDPTWFDALGGWCLRHIQRRLPRQRGYWWSGGFVLFAALCVAWAAGLAAHAVVYALPLGQAAPQFLAAGLLLVAARHFLTATGISAAAALPRAKLITRTPDHVAVAPAGAVPAAPRGSDSRPFIQALKAAGLNVRIARAVCAAGLRSGEQVRACADAQLLAIPGIGPATLRKLRQCFGPRPGAAQAQSNAA